MITLNIQFHDKITKFPQIFVLLIYRKNFVGTQKRVRISHGKRAIGVRAIEVRLYWFSFTVAYSRISHEYSSLFVIVIDFMSSLCCIDLVGRFYASQIFFYVFLYKE